MATFLNLLNHDIEKKISWEFVYCLFSFSRVWDATCYAADWIGGNATEIMLWQKANLVLSDVASVTSMVSILFSSSWLNLDVGIKGIYGEKQYVSNRKCNVFHSGVQSIEFIIGIEMFVRIITND